MEIVVKPDIKSKLKKKCFTPIEHSRAENPKVSIIVPVYKVEKYLTQCIQSIINQTLEDIEIIIVDEGEADRCRTIIDFFEKNDPRIVAPHQKNGGYGASCNLGFSLARGKYIGLVESDDFIDPEMYEELYDYAEMLHADIVKSSFYEYSDIDGDHLYFATQSLAEQLPDLSLFSAKEFPHWLAYHPSVWSCLYRRDYLSEKQLRFVNEKGASYVDCLFRIQTFMETDRIAYLNKAYYHWRITSEGSTTNNWRPSAIINRWKQVHQYLADKYVDADLLGQYIIREEYWNVFHIPLDRNIPLDCEEWNEITKIINNYSEDMIEKSPVLDKEEKRYLLLLKKEPDQCKKYAVKKRKEHNESIALLKLTSTNSMLWYFSGCMVTSIVALSVENVCFFAVSFCLAIMMLFSIAYRCGRQFCVLTNKCRRFKEEWKR